MENAVRIALVAWVMRDDADRRSLTIKVLFAQPGLSIAEQGAQGRAKLLGTSFAEYERAFREQLADMFAPGGLDPR